MMNEFYTDAMLFTHAMIEIAIGLLAVCFMLWCLMLLAKEAFTILLQWKSGYAEFCWKLERKKREKEEKDHE